MDYKKLTELGLGFLVDVSRDPCNEVIDEARAQCVEEFHRRCHTTRALRGFCPSAAIIALGDEGERRWPGLTLSQEARNYMMTWTSRPGCKNMAQNIIAADSKHSPA